MLAYCVLTLLCVVPLTRGDSTEDQGIKLILEIKDHCWFHKSDDPVLICTVNSIDFDIKWRNVDYIGMDGRPAGTDRSHYNITSHVNSSFRQEQLRISSQFATSLCINNQSAFFCENQGCSSPNFYLHIPACDDCEECSTVTSKEPLGLNNPVDLYVGDLRWFCNSEDAVLTCTTPPRNISTVWRHNNNMIVFDAKPLTASLYNLSRYSNSTTGQEKLRVSRNVAISSVLQHSEFNCEIQGYSSKNVYLHITECSTGIENDDDNNNNSSSNTSSVTSGKNSSNTWIFVGLGIAIAVLLTGAVICSYCRYRNLCSVDEGTEATTEDEREIDSMLHVGDEATSKV